MLAIAMPRGPVFEGFRAMYLLDGLEDKPVKQKPISFEREIGLVRLFVVNLLLYSRRHITSYQ